MDSNSKRNESDKSIALKNCLNDIENILDIVITNVCSQPRMSSVSNKRLLFFCGTMSSINTLDSIKCMCSKRNIVDSFVLIRKIRDNLLLDLFLLFDVINNKNSIEPKSFFNDDGSIDEKNLFEALRDFEKNCFEHERNDTRKKTIDKWYNDDLSKKENRKEREEVFGYSKYIKIITTNPLINECYDLFLKQKFMRIDNSLNNYVHSNGITFIDNRIYVLDSNIRNKAFLLIIDILNELIECYIILLFLIDEFLLQSSDYIDSLDMNSSPIDDSKNYVAPCFLDVFKKIRDNEPQLFAFLEKNNRYGLFIKEEDYQF